MKLIKILWPLIKFISLKKNISGLHHEMPKLSKDKTPPNILEKERSKSESTYQSEK